MASGAPRRTKPSPREMREANAALVLRALSQGGPRSLDELVDDTGLARATVYSALTDDGLVRRALTARPRDVRLSSGPGGRARAYYALQPYVALGVDFDHDRVRVCITDLRGVSLWHQHVRLTQHGDELRLWSRNSAGKTLRDDRVPLAKESEYLARFAPGITPGDPRTGGAVDGFPGFALNTAVELAEAGLAALGASPPAFWPDEGHEAVLRGDTEPAQPVTKDHVLGIGVSMAAPVDFEAGTASPSVLPSWREIRPAAAMRAGLGLSERVRLVVGNDANLGAWAEYRHSGEPGNRYGCREAPRSLLFIKTAPGASGIGAGLVSQDTRGQVTIYRGANMAGEIGHIWLDWPQDQPDEERTTEPCPHCGRVTCLQARTALPIFFPRGSPHDTWDDLVESLRHIGPAARFDTAEADAVIKAGARLGRALGTVVTLLNPDLIVISGPLSHVLVAPGEDSGKGDVALLRPGATPELIVQLQAVATTDAFAVLTQGRDTPAVFRTGLGWWAVALGAAYRVLDFETEQLPFFLSLLEDGAAAEAA